jgi:hypothetical protein
MSNCNQPESLPKVTLVSFGNDTFYGPLSSLKRESQDFPMITNTAFYTDKDLKNIPEFWERHGSFIENNKRGYGYWLWKSFIVLHTLSKMENGEILCYADAGCTLYKDGINRFIDYIKIVEHSNHGVLSFRMTHLQKTYTKMDTLLKIDNGETKDKGQIAATAFFIRKCDKIMELIKEWYDICCDNKYHWIDDTPSTIPNDETFIDHRHDQSVFSLLLYKYGTDMLDNETYPFSPTFPIFASRRR